MEQNMRLNKVLAIQLGLSRREADLYISRGRVSINGAPASLGAHVNPEADLIFLDGKKLEIKPPEHTYLILHKPTGYVCSRRPQGSTPTIYELLPKKYHHLKSVGRLDKDSSGLLLLTNDGDFAHHMTHPKFNKQKMYKVTLDKSLEPDDKTAIEKGITVENYTSQLHLKHLKNNTWQVTMHQGRNRQIRRTFAALGYTVTSLHRTHFGPYALKTLAAGDYAQENRLIPQ